MYCKCLYNLFSHRIILFHFIGPDVSGKRNLVVLFITYSNNLASFVGRLPLQSA